MECPRPPTVPTVEAVYTPNTLKKLNTTYPFLELKNKHRTDNGLAVSQQTGTVTQIHSYI